MVFGNPLQYRRRQASGHRFQKRLKGISVIVMNETGVIHGRFQIFHNDHLRYLLAGRQRCRHLVVGITNPDPSFTRDDPAAPLRSRSENNPLTYYERYQCVKSALIADGVPDSEFSVVPFPINHPEYYRYYVPMEAIFYLTIYDEWGRKKHDLFVSMGLKTEILWEKPIEQKGLSSSDIRNCIIIGEPWEHYVPPVVYRLLNDWNIADRLRQNLKGG